MATRDSVPSYGQTPSPRCSLIAFLSAQWGLGDKLGHLIDVSGGILKNPTAVVTLYSNDMGTLNTAFPSSAFDTAIFNSEFNFGMGLHKEQGFFTVC